MMSSRILNMYENVSSLLSRNYYTPALALGELLSLIITYVAGMGIAVYKLPLSGYPITAHIYAAAIDTVLAISLYGSTTRSGNLILRILAVLDILSVLGAAFEGLFYFGGFSTPCYAIGMGTGFVFTIAFTSALFFYSLRR
jgi:hypothetical protein